MKGQNWRTTDPGLDENIRQQLVDALMEGRRWVRDANRTGDPAALRAARAHVDLAKRALGERGQRWWTIEADGIDEARVLALAAILRWATRKRISLSEARSHLVD